jgi:DNA-binding NarL/FixJ family response regulator
MSRTTDGCQRVLIVEDHEPSRASLARLLKLNGRDVETASTIDEAMDKLHAWQPGCIVLDLRVGEGRGEDVLRHIREEQMRVKVSIVTGSADPEQMMALQHLQPDHILYKPISFSDLMKWMDSAA